MDAQLCEYALNLDPNLADTDKLPTSSTAINPADNKSYFTYTYRRRIDGGGLQYLVEVSPEFDPWSPVTDAIEQIGTATPHADGVIETVTVRVKPSLDSEVRQFVRLHILAQ